ncbi:MAG: DCL family protein [Patescibacteria group bacterium]
MIEIGEKTFKTIGDAEDFIRTILYKYPLNEPLIGDDLVFICELLKLHPDKDEKIALGVKSIIVERDATFGKTHHFSIVRPDNSTEDFSLKKCLTQSMNDPARLFSSSARRVVADQIVSFRNSFFNEKQDLDGNVTCALSGALISRNTSHIDHIPPLTFRMIVSNFISINKIDINHTKFIAANNGIGKEFLDENIKNNFYDYHMKVAKLRVIAPLENLKQKRY